MNSEPLLTSLVHYDDLRANAQSVERVQSIDVVTTTNDTQAEESSSVNICHFAMKRHFRTEVRMDLECQFPSVRIKVKQA